jgi:dihydroorotate dehydrogenase electron transfer subunit
MPPSHRNTIFVEDALVTEHRAFPGQQHVLRLAASRCAATASPGTFVHIQCDADIPMRRPLSIMRADAGAGWIEVLFKVVGRGLEALAAAKPGERLSIIGPIGHGFTPDPLRPKTVLIGGGVGIPPLVFLAERLATSLGRPWRPVAFFGSELPFPFRPARDEAALHGLDHRWNACMPVLQSLGVPSRLATLAGFDGCYFGYVTALAGEWLAALHREELGQVAIYACGPEPMLHAAARLAHDFGVPCQVCLEEFMACGVGGCAGCAVPVLTDKGPAMKRVCVDGPVFDARVVYPDLF